MNPVIQKSTFLPRTAGANPVQQNRIRQHLGVTSVCFLVVWFTPLFFQKPVPGRSWAVFLECFRQASWMPKTARLFLGCLLGVCRGRRSFAPCTPWNFHLHGYQVWIDGEENKLALSITLADSRPNLLEQNEPSATSDKPPSPRSPSDIYRSMCYVHWLAIACWCFLVAQCCAFFLIV